VISNFLVILLGIKEFIGHFHPVIVHLPIGIMILGIVMQWVARKDPKGQMHTAISISFLLGTLSALLACLTGYLLSISDDYGDGIVDWHFWMGLSVAFSSGILYMWHVRKQNLRWQLPLGVVVCVLIIITGHLGGTLTHGEGYLTNSLFAEEEAATAKRKPLPNVQEAMAYQEVVQPLLQSKCYGCHNANKKKGGLQMDKPELLMKGGKNGEIIIPTKAEESEMIRRLLLPREDDDHMPPKEKPQLSEQEIALLHWWIASGASFDKKVKELEQPEKIQPILKNLENDVEEYIVESNIPEEPVEQASEDALAKLRATGAVVLPVAQNSNYLMANFITARPLTDADMQLLLPLKKQLVWLKLGGTKIGDSALLQIGQCNNLMRVQLEHTAISDAGLAALKNLHQLKYLNLVGTKVTAKGLEQLKDLKKLKSLYLYQTKVEKSEWPMLQKIFPGTHIDSGGYKVPTLESDTTVLKYNPNKK
jgi:uncharacterized membrane protein/mono/diheme cytochrome c family protein